MATTKISFNMFVLIFWCIFFCSLGLCLSLITQASHQLRFLREWAVFGRALRRSVWELLGVALALLLLMLAYSHTGHLVRFFIFFILCVFFFFFWLAVGCATHTQSKHNVNLYIIHDLQLHNPVKICPPTFVLCTAVFSVQKCLHLMSTVCFYNSTFRQNIH